MEKRPINFYTSNPTDGGFRSLATLLNQEQPVRLRDISELPAPDRQRPTRQQLLTQRATAVLSLDSCREYIQLATPYPRLADELTRLKQEEELMSGIIERIDTALLAQEGGQSNG